MKSKKLISLLCAAALTASSFASLAITASAATEDDILWSDTFNNQATGIIADGTLSQVTNSEYISGLTFVTANRGSGDRGKYTDSNGDTVWGGSYYAVMDDKADTEDKYLRLSFPVFGDFEKNGRWAYVSLGDGYAATDDKDVVMDFDVKLTDGIDKGEKAANGNPVLRIGSFDADAKTATAVEIDKDANSIGDDWVHARIIVSNSTGAKLYIDGEEVTGAANASVKTLATIGLYSDDATAVSGPAMTDLVGNSTYDDGTLNEASKPTKTAIADVDNVIIYNEAAGVATGTSTAPGAQGQEGGATPKPVVDDSKVEIAPVLVAPSDVAGLETYAFDNNATKKWSLGTAAQEITEIDGLKINIGGRDKGGTVDTYAAVTGIEKGKVLQLAGCQYATAGRGPVVSVNSSLPVSYSDGLNTVMTFAVRLSAAKGHEDEAEPRLFLLKDNTQAGDDGTGAYRNVAAVLTTVEGETIYRGDDSSSDAISAYITPDEWHVVTLVITPTGEGSATHRLYVDAYGSDEKPEPAVKCDYVATGTNATYMSDLPVLAIESKAAKVNGVDTSPSYGVAMIDELNVYQGTASEPRRLLPTVGEAPEPTVENHEARIEWNNETKKATVTAAADEEAAFDGVLIHAAYYDNGTIKSVKTYDAKNITTDGIEVAFDADDTVYEGDKLMLWSDLQSMVPYGMLEVEDGEEPVVTYAVKNATAADAHGTVTLSKTNALAGDEITVTVTPDEDYELDTLTVVDSDNEVVAVTDGKFTMPAKNVTVTATFKAKQVAPTTYTVSGTVDAGVDTVALKPETGDAINGTIADGKVTFANVPAGTYTITVTAKTGYEVDTIKVADTAAETVTVADADVTTLAITTKQSTTPVTKYTVTVDSEITGGSVTADKTTDLSENDTVTLTVTPAEGNQLKANSLKVMNGETAVTTTAGENGTYTFAMPAANVTVTAEFEAIPAATYTVSGTVDAGVASVKLTEKLADDAGEDAVAKTYTGTIADTAVTFANVPAGTYTIAATAVSGKEIDTIKVADVAATTVTVTDADVTTLVITTKDEAIIPYAEGTLTFDNDGAATAFQDYSRVTSTVTDGVNGNATKVNDMLTGSGGVSGAGYNVYAADYPATGDAVKVTFDFTEPTRNAWVSVRGTQPGTGNRDNNATSRIFTIGCEGSEVLKLYTGDETDATKTIAGTDGLTKWYHVDATINNTAKTVAIKVYDYKANNNYENATALYDGTVAFRDKTVTGVVAMDYHSATNGGRMQMDNIYINDPSYVAPIAVTVTGATVDKTAALESDVITITPNSPEAGKKLAAVKVNNETIIAGQDGAYKYTVKGTEESIAVTAEFVRADVTAIAISGDSSVQIATDTAKVVQYTAQAKAGVTDVEGTITWSVDAKDGSTKDAGTTIDQQGNLTIATTQTAGTLVITVSTPKDITLTGEDLTAESNQIKQTYEVALVTDPVYQITKGTETNGTFTIKDGTSADVSTAQVKENTAITVTPTAGKGHRVKKVSYVETSPAEGAQAQTGDATTSEDGVTYTFNSPAYAFTVNVEFEAIPYTITNSNSAAENGNSLAVKVGENEVTSATIGQTVTITPTIATSYGIKSLTVTGSQAIETTKNEDSYTFTMPAEDVTITAVFAEKATLSLAYYTTVDNSESKLGSVVIYDGFAGDDASQTEIASDLIATTVKVHDDEQDLDAYRKYTYSGSAVDLSSYTSLTAGNTDIKLTVTADSDTNQYYYVENFETLDAGTTWGDSCDSNSYSGVVSAAVWPSAKYGGFVISNNSAANLSNNQAVLLATHKNGTAGIVKNLPGAGNKTISFKLAKNESSGGRSQILKFVDNLENEALRIKISVKNSKGTELDGFYYSVDGGATYTALSDTTDTTLHAYVIDFDMTNKKVSISFDGTAKASSVALADSVTGTGIASMNMVNGYSVVSSIMDDIVVKPYTPTSD